MTPELPVVSVVIPTYNQADLLEKALKSVVSQTFCHWEAIVIDNFSPDNTRIIVESQNDPRIRYVQFSNNGIIAASRNLGISLARGEFIAFLDSDDLWYPGKLAVCLEHLRKGTDAVCHGLQIRRDGVLAETVGPHPVSGRVYDDLLFNGNTMIATSSVIIKKECFSRYGIFSVDPKIVTAEDYELWIRLAKNNIRWELLPDILGEYIVHSRNASRNINRQMLAEEKIVISYFRGNPQHSFRERVAFRKRRMMLVLHAGMRVWQSGEHWPAIGYFLKGIASFFH
jgi:glycosyltransferase involved in cell wall biosynthesis